MTSTASQEGNAVVHHAKDAAADVASTAKDQSRQVAHEAKHQTRQVVEDVRQRVGREADDQARRVSQGINKIADELSSMAEHSSEGSPAAGALRQVADTGRQAARFLDERGASGLLETAQDFARRKPGTFLIGAALTGFLVGRVVKSASGSSESQPGRMTGRPDATRTTQAETWQSVQPAVAQPAVAPPAAAPPAAEPTTPYGEPLRTTAGPYDDPPAPRTPQHATPGGGGAHVQP